MTEPVDPLADVVALLQPAARATKVVLGAGPWQVRRSDFGQPFYCAVLEGGCRMAVDGHEPVELQAGDFALIPAVWGVTVSSLEASQGPDMPPVALGEGRFRIGRLDGPADLRMLAGHCTFGSPDAALLVSLLPQFVHVRGEPRLATLMQLVGDETREQRPAREEVLARLLEVLLIEAFRSMAGPAACADALPGLPRGLADERLAVALRAMHGEPARAWTVPELAKEAALSRTTFFERFSRALGVAPMEYLLGWRMALAKEHLRRGATSVAAIAERVGYSSASTFSVAFSRHVGMPPTQYAKSQVGT